MTEYSTEYRERAVVERVAADHEDEDAGLVPLAEHVVRTVTATHDTKTQVLPSSAKFNRLLKESFKMH